MGISVTAKKNRIQSRNIHMIFKYRQAKIRNKSFKNYTEQSTYYINVYIHMHCINQKAQILSHIWKDVMIDAKSESGRIGISS